jgi:5-methylcytosine-specific restriction endonuclease McrA
MRAYQSAYRKNNPDVHRASKRRRRERIKTNGGIFLIIELIAMRVEQDGICAYCQHRYHPRSLTIDHVIPILQGGRHEATNIVLAWKVQSQQRCPHT